MRKFPSRLQPMRNKKSNTQRFFINFHAITSAMPCRPFFYLSTSSSTNEHRPLTMGGVHKHLKSSPCVMVCMDAASPKWNTGCNSVVAQWNLQLETLRTQWCEIWRSYGHWPGDRKCTGVKYYTDLLPATRSSTISPSITCLILMCVYKKKGAEQSKL